MVRLCRRLAVFQVDRKACGGDSETFLQRMWAKALRTEGGSRTRHDILSTKERGDLQCALSDLIYRANPYTNTLILGTRKLES